MLKIILLLFSLCPFAGRVFSQSGTGRSFNGISATAGIKLVLGNCNDGIGINFTVEERQGNFKICGGGAVTGFALFSKLRAPGIELRGSLLGGFDDSKIAITAGTNLFRGLFGLSLFNQRTGIFNVKIGEFNFSYENDGSPFPKLGLSDGFDSYRTAAVRVGYGDFSVGFNLFTGSRTSYVADAAEMALGLRYGLFGERMPYGYVTETGFPYRLGIVYAAYKEFKVGASSDRWARHGVQDIFAHGWLSPQPGFHSLTRTIKPFYQFRNSYTSVRFTLHD